MNENQTTYPTGAQDEEELREAGAHPACKALQDRRGSRAGEEGECIQGSREGIL